MVQFGAGLIDSRVFKIEIEKKLQAVTNIYESFKFEFSPAIAGQGIVRMF